jgi:hypothetical protein
VARDEQPRQIVAIRDERTWPSVLQAPRPVQAKCRAGPRAFRLLAGRAGLEVLEICERALSSFQRGVALERQTRESSSNSATSMSQTVEPFIVVSAACAGSCDVRRAAWDERRELRGL